MKVYPRILEVSKGNKQCDFFIENGSSMSDILLFKIRRTDPKVVDFNPKMGQIPPGASMTISVSMTDPEAYSGRVIVKFVAIKRKKLCENFSDSWDIGLSRGMAKKIVEVRNTSVLPSALDAARARIKGRRSTHDADEDDDDIADFETFESSFREGEADSNVKQTAGKDLIGYDSASVTSSLSGIERAEEFYYTLKGINDSIKNDIASTGNSRGSSPRAMDKKLLKESIVSKKNIVDDLIMSHETMLMSPELVQISGETYAVKTPFSTDQTRAIVSERHQFSSSVQNGQSDTDASSQQIAPQPSIEMRNSSLLPPRYKMDSSPLVESTASPVALTNRKHHNPQSDSVSGPSSPIGDVRMHRRHSPVSKGGIMLAGGSPGKSSQDKMALKDIAISIPSTENDYDGASFDSGSEMENIANYGQQPVSIQAIPSKPTERCSAVRAEQQSSRHVDVEDIKDEDSHSVISDYSKEEYTLPDDVAENGSQEGSDIKLEMKKYAKMEEIALHNSEWRSLTATRAAIEEYEAIANEMSRVENKSNEKIDYKKINAIIHHVSAGYMPLSELPISDKRYNRSGAPEVIEVRLAGNEISDEVARLALRLRTAEVFYAGDLVTSISIENATHFTSLWALDELFKDNNTSGRSGDIMHSRSAVKKAAIKQSKKERRRQRHGEDANGIVLNRGLGSAFEDMLITGIMRLTVKHCPSVHSISSTLLSSLKSLIHLDLSHNKIRDIQGELGLEMPHLQRLNLSNNLLKSLDKLQGLSSLTSLDASHNYIQTLHHGSHMLLPLARHLISLNLLDNPICALPSYAGETVSLLPNLICFDMRYTRLFASITPSNAHKISQGPSTMVSEERIISVPKGDSSLKNVMDHNYFVIKKNSPDGYAALHSPSKKQKNKRSPNTNVSKTQSPEVVPFYPKYGKFHSSPGILVEANGKGYGQPHKEPVRGFASPDDVSIASSQNSLDSTDDATRQMLRAMRAFRAMEEKKGSKRHGDRIEKRRSYPKQQTVHVDPFKRCIVPSRTGFSSSNKPTASSAQTLLSHVSKLDKNQMNKVNSHVNQNTKKKSANKSDNSVDTDLIEQESVDDEDTSVQSGTEYSVGSGQWSEGSAEKVLHPPQVVGSPVRRHPRREQVSGSAHVHFRGRTQTGSDHMTLHNSASDISSVRKNSDHSHNIVSNNAIRDEHHGSAVFRAEPLRLSSNWGRRSVTLPISHNSDTRYFRKYDHLYDRSKVPDKTQISRSRTPPKYRMVTAVGDSDSRRKWMLEVESAARSGHRNIARSTSGISFGYHSSTLRRSASPTYRKPQRARSVDRRDNSEPLFKLSGFDGFSRIVKEGPSAHSLDTPFVPQERESSWRAPQLRHSLDDSSLHTKVEYFAGDASLEEIANELFFINQFDEHQIKSHSNFTSKQIDVRNQGNRSVSLLQNRPDSSLRKGPLAFVMSRSSGELSRPNFEKSDGKPLLFGSKASDATVNFDSAPILNTPEYLGLPAATIKASNEAPLRKHKESVQELLSLLQNEIRQDSPPRKPTFESDLQQINKKTKETPNDQGRFEDTADSANTLDENEELVIGAENISSSAIRDSENEEVEDLNQEAEDLNEYLNWLENQVTAAVDNLGAELTTAIKAKEKLSSSEPQIDDEEGNQISDNEYSVAEEIEPTVSQPVGRFDGLLTELIAQDDLLDDAVKILSNETIRTGKSDEKGIVSFAIPVGIPKFSKATVEVPVVQELDTDNILEADVNRSLLSESESFTPLKSANLSETYPPTPSPLPPVKHPRQLAMKAQQHSPTSDWNPLTRILRPEDDSADIYPKYHA